MEYRDTTNFYSLLLSYSEEAVIVFDAEGDVKFSNKALSKLLGYESYELLNEQTFIKQIHKEYKPALIRFLRTLIEKPGVVIKTDLKYRHKNGKWLLLGFTGINLLKEPSVAGLVIFLRNVSYKAITKRLDRTIQKLLSITNHSQEVIIRTDKGRQVLFLNPRVSYYWKGSVQEYILKSLSELPFYYQVKDPLERTITDVFFEREEKSLDITVLSNLGSRDFRVEVIPELFGDTVETVLLILHDITDIKEAQRKIAEQKEELERKNKDILDSIRYARRIQHSILPAESLFAENFLEYFILFQAKDMVSGDFYWFHKQEDGIIWLAGIDCTGHGVPGSFMSIIANSLLNEIVRSKKIHYPNRVLEELDRSLVKLLGQDQEGSAQDGMEIGLLRINRKNMSLQYSGAKRSLLWFNDGVLKTLKGARREIGGTILQRQKDIPFFNNQILLQEGDILYVFSDGIPDQSGGPKNKKFGTKRIKEFIKKHHNLPLSEQKELFLEKWKKWKGNNPQIDDILFIAVKI